MSEANPPPALILTIGHSNHPWPQFLKLLENAGIGNVVDVRTKARSRWPQYSLPAFRARLNFHGICYEHLLELGGIQRECSPLTYDEVAETPEFHAGIEHLLQTSRRCKTAVVCSEHSYLLCHRFLLLSRVLAARGIPVGHIQRDGSVEAQWLAELHLLRVTKLDKDDLLTSMEERLAQAYKLQEQRVIGAGGRKWQS